MARPIVYSRWTEMVAGLYLLAVLGAVAAAGLAYIRLGQLEPIRHFELKVYPGVTEAQVLDAVGQPDDVVTPAQPDANARLYLAYEPKPKLAIERQVLVYGGGQSRFLVYINHAGVVTCVVQTWT